MNYRSLTTSLCLTGLLASLAALPGCDEDDSTTTGDEQDATSSIDDTFTKSILAGGCSIKVQKTGKTSKTKGTGGKCPTTVTGVLDVLKADTKVKTHVYAVSEEGDLTPGKNTPYRFVVAVDLGDGKAEKLFLSVLGSGAGVSDDFIEVMGFNEKKGAYVFYDLEDGAWNQIGDGTMVKTDADSQHDAPAFRCQGCHKTGTPLMKELHDSWMNWNSTWFSMGDPGGTQELFKRLFSAKERADDLELLVIAGTKTAVKTRVDKAVKEKNLAPMLKQLMCDIGEPSLIAAHMKNSKRTPTVETFSSMVPTSILLNPLFQSPRTGTGTQKGLDNIVNMSIPSLSSVKIDSASYVKAIGTIGQTIGGARGDAMFPMSSPEMSWSDIQVVQELFSRNLIDKDLVTDVLMTDFTVSTFSKARCDLAATLPKNWTNADDLRTQWATALKSSSVRGAKGLKARLDNKTDFDTHAKTVDTYIKSCVDRSNAEKDAYAVDLLKIMSQRRAEFADRYEPVVESDFLLPGDNLKSVPHANRLSATTCKIEGQSTKFVGEE